MRTSHRVVVGDSRDLSSISDDSVDLVVTSPPYPMIEMWDDTFGELDSDIEDALDTGDGRDAFERMHAELDRVWDEVERVLVDGGIACVNVGDATRKVDGTFRVYQNHARVVEAFEDRGFDPLPDVLWRKPANSAAKFMGSGMLPPNAYVTLEHEYVLVFRNGDGRRFEPGADRRYEAAYFWEERNRWFSDVWTDVRGETQALDGDEARQRSGAFPFEIPYRLINMYSVYGDTVLDPFWGTGTTTIAAMTAARNSIGVEIDGSLVESFDDRVEGIERFAAETIRTRLDRHREFVEERQANGDDLNYEAETYDFPVMTKQEREIQFYRANDVETTSAGYTVDHEPMVESTGPSPRPAAAGGQVTFDGGF